MNHDQIEALKDTAARVDALEIVLGAIVYETERTSPGSGDRIRASVGRFLAQDGAAATRMGRSLSAMLSDEGFLSA